MNSRAVCLFSFNPIEDMCGLPKGVFHSRGGEGVKKRPLPERPIFRGAVGNASAIQGTDLTGSAASGTAI